MTMPGGLRGGVRCGTLAAMQHLRISTPRELTAAVLTVMHDDHAISSLSCVRGASLEPDGDLVEADVAREAVNDVVDRLRSLGVQQEGTVHIQPVITWLSRAGLEAEPRTQARLLTRSCGRRSRIAHTRSRSSTGPISPS